MKVVIIGGHLSPALAIAEKLPKTDEILFIGRKYVFEGDKAVSLEYKTIRSLKILFVNLTTGRLQRKFTRHTILSLLKLPYGFTQAIFALIKFQPDVVLSFGGYLSFPVILSAFLLRIPVVLHEQTLEAGLANKILSVFAKKICISWETSRKFFPKEKIVLTGNPIRQFSIFNFPASQRGEQFSIPKNGLPIIYIMGGSAGSHFINTLIEKNLEKLLTRFNILHQTGNAKEDQDYERLRTIRNTLPLDLQSRYILTKFIDPSLVGGILKKADIVISRAGINTITELIFFGVPSLLIPLPFSQRQEQLKNALFLKTKGCAEIFEQKDDEELFVAKLFKMFENLNKYRQNLQEISSLVNTNASQKIIEVLEYVKKKE